jgi:hypothetical protein
LLQFPRANVLSLSGFILYKEQEKWSAECQKKEVILTLPFKSRRQQVVNMTKKSSHSTNTLMLHKQ